MRKIIIYLPAILIISLIFIKITLDKSERLENINITVKQEKKIREDKLLGGLLSANFTKSSCLSRNLLLRFRNSSPHKPSSYLISKLRSYESLHKHCSPNTNPYNDSIKFLHSSNASNSCNCKYIVLIWLNGSGLGNRLLSLVSSFLYSILTDRVLLIDQGSEMDGLLCEPFPNSTWELPSDFPIRDLLKGFQPSSSSYFVNIFKDFESYKYMHVPSSAYINLNFYYNDNDKRFFCGSEQNSLTHVPWLFIMSDQYFVPSLFRIPSFEKELTKLFPKIDTIFHFLGYYLLHPSDDVWGLVTKFYDTYLAKADERIGIQIRDFGATHSPFQGMKDHIFKNYFPHLENKKDYAHDKIDLMSPFSFMMDKVLECLVDKNLLLRANNPYQERKSKVVLVTSLNATYLENLTLTYSKNSAINIFQPSHDGHQEFDDLTQNMQALAEMYLLSFMDELITSPWSTFGYVAQGLGGFKPWVIDNPQKKTSIDRSSCYRAESMDPCFHFPPVHDCEVEEGIETMKNNTYVRHCEDTIWGLKLVVE